MTDAAQSVRRSQMINVFLVAGEESGDRLGAALMRALKEHSGEHVRFAGVGGATMAAAGLASLFSITDLAIMGFTAIPRRLPLILRRIRETANAVIAANPDVLVIIDSPDFTHRVARRVRRALPSLPIIDYVSPSVWAWRPGRARSMRGYIDHVLALLPFEPEVHRRLGGPPCTYVGHPMTTEVSDLRPDAEEGRRRLAAPPVLLMLPGSRAGEIQRHFGVFAESIAQLTARVGTVEVVVPTIPHLVDLVRQASAQWRIAPRIVVETVDKHAAFRVARAALTKSGTATLELALSGVPMVAAYKVSALEAMVGRPIQRRLPSVILANLVLGENVVPEFLQEACTPDRLAQALVPLFSDMPERRRQIEAFSKLDAIMKIGTGAPAARAAEIVLQLATVSQRP